MAAQSVNTCATKAVSKILNDTAEVALAVNVDERRTTRKDMQKKGK